MFTTNINTKMFYKKINDTNNRWTLMKLEKQIDEYLEKYEKQLEDEMIEDILDIRDTIITRLSQLRREEMMMTYLETPIPTTSKNEEQDNNNQVSHYQNLLQKKNELEAELQKINKELEKVTQIVQYQ
jgi:hypothetical protein